MLDTVASIKPFFFTNHTTGAKEIFIQDMKNNTYLINAAGRVLWKVPLTERIFGNIYMIDYFRNGKYQLLFSGRNFIHILDRNGNYVERYPVKLRSPATNSLSLFDYDNNMNYRLFIAGEDKMIDLESVENGELTKEVVVFKNDAPSRAQRVVEKDDILFQMVRPYQKNNLYFDRDGDYVASTGYAQIKTIQSSRFMYQYLHLHKFVDEVIERCTGTSYPAINSNNLAKICICYPQLPEQQKIASFFSAIDQKISQLKKEKNLLELYKKGVMQKIFSQEIRLVCFIKGIRTKL